MTRTPVFALLLATACAAHAKDFRAGPDAPRPHPPGPPGGVPSPESLATAPGLTAAQQIEVRRILIERRDAHDKLHAKDDAERRAAMARSRSDHERIDDESSARLRKLLGDDGYRALAEWLIPPRGAFAKMHRPAPDAGDARPDEPPRLGAADVPFDDDGSPVR